MMDGMISNKTRNTAIKITSITNRTIILSHLSSIGSTLQMTVLMLMITMMMMKKVKDSILEKKNLSSMAIMRMRKVNYVNQNLSAQSNNSFLRRAATPLARSLRSWSLISSINKPVCLTSE